jgi:hypothetical protein
MSNEDQINEDEFDENEIVRCFYSYLEESNAGDAVRAMLEDCRDSEDMNVEQTLLVFDNFLVPQIIQLFAERYDALTQDDHQMSHDLNDIFQLFVSFENLSEAVADKIALAINSAAAHAAADDPDNDDGDHSNDGNEDADEYDPDIDDNDVVFKPQDWVKLSDAQRQQKVKLFVKKLATCHIDSREMRPFLKNLNVGDQENPWGIKVGEKVKPFNREKHRFGHTNNLGSHASEDLSESTKTYKDDDVKFVRFPEQGHEAERHPLHNVLQKYNFQRFRTVPVTMKDGSYWNHHSWKNQGHIVGAYSGNSNWSSKTSESSAHVFTGRGAKDLNQHLANKQKRYKLQNNESVAHTKIQEGLFDGYEKVKLYADWINRNPAQTFGHVDETSSPAQQLVETARQKAKADQFLNRDGKDRSDWSLFDYRSGREK